MGPVVNRRRALAVVAGGSLVLLVLLLAVSSTKNSSVGPPMEQHDNKTDRVVEQFNRFCKSQYNNNTDDNNNAVCRCTDPHVPAEWIRPEWLPHHERLVQQAHFSADKKVDVVLVGDSLVELWNGTQRWGLRHLPRMKQMADQIWMKSNLSSLALGTTGDTAPNLLWHLHHGLLLNSSSLNPKVWMILIGTNDLARTLCSPQTTLDGILVVADYLHRQRPQASILIHGLLPRGQGRNNGGMLALGTLWQDIQWVNAQLQQQVAQQQQNTNRNWYYRDTGTMFLINEEGSAKLNPVLLPDGIHPSVQGLHLWGNWLVTQIHDLLQHNRFQTPP